MSDSQAALHALLSYTVTSKLVNECITVLNDLGAKNKVLLGWVPGHEGHEGNEQADHLAKQGALAAFCGPEPFCGLTRAHIRETMNEWETKQFRKHWTDCLGQRQAKLFILPSKGASARLINLGKEDLKILTGYFTGHCGLRYHLSKLGLSDTQICRFCELDNETPVHILCECSALARKRLSYLGGGTLNPVAIWDRKPENVLKFIKSLHIQR